MSVFFLTRLSFFAAQKYKTAQKRALPRSQSRERGSERVSGSKPDAVKDVLSSFSVVLCYVLGCSSQCDENIGVTPTILVRYCYRGLLLGLDSVHQSELFLCPKRVFSQKSVLPLSAAMFGLCGELLVCPGLCPTPLRVSLIGEVFLVSRKPRWKSTMAQTSKLYQLLLHFHFVCFTLRLEQQTDEIKPAHLAEC